MSEIGRARKVMSKGVDLALDFIENLPEGEYDQTTLGKEIKENHPFKDIELQEGKPDVSYDRDLLFYIDEILKMSCFFDTLSYFIDALVVVHYKIVDKKGKFMKSKCKKFDANYPPEKRSLFVGKKRRIKRLMNRISYSGSKFEINSVGFEEDTDFTKVDKEKIEDICECKLEE